MFAARTRGDGSFRNTRFFHGYHGGIDIPAPEGTPILAVAAGTVVEKKYGQSIGGIEIILQHSPDDTGLSVWLYSQYKHLMKIPDIETGKRVVMGEPIGLVGKTGTIGGHYGAQGSSHLHLSIFMSQVRDYKAMMVFIPVKGWWVDPLAIYTGKDLMSHSVRSLPEKEKNVTIPYMTTNHKFIPDISKFIWPLACDEN